ncbi:LexA family transcriptional regulator [Desulfovermiculus halophilus]|uniref:LexA family transcriptional regulator n=1 Tax=Desulfovermiculus halophilus TaxID=339722 RepID=UPI0006881DC4|nr:S24 family peptidase [Desulfovermiculus halophilus]
MASSQFQAFMRRLAQAAGIDSQSELASVLELNRSAVSRAKSRDRVPEQWIAKLCALFSLDPDWLRDGQSSLDRFVEVPIVTARLGAGGGSHVVDADVQGHIAFRSSWLHQKGRPRDMVLMQVVGDSMEPGIREGDYVLIDQSKQEIYPGGVYALGLEDAIMIKQVDKRPDELIIISANSKYSPITLRGDELETVRIIGRVLGIWRDFGWEIMSPMRKQ